MAVTTLDPKQVFIIIGGAHITGYADGSFIEVDRDEDSFTKKTGADGLTARAKSNNRGASFKITLMQTSPSNDVLTAFMLADEAESNAVQPVMVKDGFGTSLFNGIGWVKKMPASAWAKEVGAREWIIDCAEMNAFVGGNS